MKPLMKPREIALFKQELLKEREKELYRSWNGEVEGVLFTLQTF
jgi:hypothetical protein